MSTIDATWIAGHVNGRSESVRTLLPPSIVLVSLIGVWEIGVGILEVPAYVLPPPSAVVAALLSNHQIILGELLTTLSAFAIAFGLTVALGYLSAIAMYQWSILETTFYPYVIIARAIPIISLIPIFIIWFGFGFRSIVLISFLISFFAMVINSLAGFKSTDEALIEMLNSFSASRWDLFRHVYLYASLPLVLAGVKIAVILVFTGVIVGEFLIGTEGIGFLILEFNNTLSTDKMFAGILTIAITQLVLFASVVLLERCAVRWT